MQFTPRSVQNQLLENYFSSYYAINTDMWNRWTKRYSNNISREKSANISNITVSLSGRPWKHIFPSVGSHTFICSKHHWPRGYINHSLLINALCLCHHYKWTRVLLWGKSQQETTEQGKTATKSALSQNSSNSNKHL